MKPERHLLAGDDREEIVLNVWRPGSETPMHTHGLSHCHFKVLHGQIRHCCLADQRGQIINAGEAIDIPMRVSHEVRADRTALSLHWYRPALGDVEDVIVRATPCIIPSDASSVSGLDELAKHATAAPWTLWRRARASHDDICRALGRPLAIHDESGGDVVVSVEPREDAQTKTASFENRMPFHLHTELPYWPTPPTYVVFTSKTANRTPTQVASIGSALSDVSTADLQELMNENFQWISPPHFKHRQKVRSAVFKVEHGRLRPKLRSDLVEVSSASARRALRNLIQTLEKSATDVLLGEDDVLVVNNRRAVHGRGLIIEKQRTIYKSYVWDEADLNRLAPDGS